MLTVIHHIEDVQVACFAIIFGLMAYQSRQDRTIRYVFFSYVLATVVSVMDVAMHQPMSAFTRLAILCIISIRYGLLALAMVVFTRSVRRPAVLSFGVAAATLLLLLGAGFYLPQNDLFAGDYLLLALQMAILGYVVLHAREEATQAPRVLLAALFALSVAFRLVQMWISVVPQTAKVLWWRDESFFVNSTVVGCLLPFTFVWLMNARHHTYLLQQTLFDPLTNLLNRRGLADAVDRELARYRRGRQEFAVAIADIDHFKALNDAYGHAHGDAVLVTFAEISRNALRKGDIVARSGGEEFTILLPLTSAEDAVQAIERLRGQFQHAPVTSTEKPTSTVSVGLTHTRGRSDITWEQLQHEADSALYEAKRKGRNRIVLSDVPSDSTVLSAKEGTGIMPLA